MHTQIYTHKHAHTNIYTHTHTQNKVGGHVERRLGDVHPAGWAPPVLREQHDEDVHTDRRVGLRVRR